MFNPYLTKNCVLLASKIQIMNRHYYILLFFILVLLFHTSAVAADEAQKKEPALKEYFNKSTKELHSPEVLKMADTLYYRAKQANDKHFQVLARLMELDYYYFKNDKNKILELVPKLKHMCREYNELDSYYFVWGSRLITFYLKSGLFNHALLEAQNMLREAQDDNYQPGIAECYKAMGNIYQAQSNVEQAALNFKKLIDIVDKDGNKDVNFPIYYYSYADNLIQIGRLDEAEEALQKAQLLLDKSEDVIDYQRLSLEQGRLALYIEKKDAERAKNSMDKIEELFATSKELSVFSLYLYECRLKYYMSVKDYPNALAIIDSIKSKKPNSESNLFILNKKAEIYWETNRKAEAAEFFRDYIFANDSLRKESMQRSADEIAGLLNLGQLEQEKQQLMIDIQNRRLTNTYWALGTLLVVLIVAAMVIVHIFRLNRQLKGAKILAEQQNDALLKSSEELKKARDKAEEASLMKTDFIQNITHEVRTPLNAIVGFSQVLVESYSEPETEEFASLITMNSSNLLRLFDDVLELSNADRTEQLPYDVIEDINSSCRAAIKKAESLMPDGVELIFHPSEENLRIKTNPPYVRLILHYLLHNAAKFTQEGSVTLQYAVSLSEGVIRYSVTDTGVDIPTDQCEVIFERFKKLDTFTQGSGLGLPVARAIATKLGGTLCVDTEYTGGARFVLTLPLIGE